MTSFYKRQLINSLFLLTSLVMFSACSKSVAVKKRANADLKSAENPEGPGDNKKTTGGSKNNPTPEPPEALKENQVEIASYINTNNVSNFPINGPCKAGEKIIIESTVGAKSQKLESICDNNEEFSVELDFSNFPGSLATIKITVQGSNGLDSEPLEFSIPIDLVVPTVSITNPAPNAATTFQTSLEGSCSDEGGIIKISAAGNPRQTTNCVSGQYSIAAIVPGPNGASSLTVTHSDAAGNEVSVAITLQRNYSFLDGNGEQDFPFLIASCQDLQDIQTHADRLTLITKHFALAANIDCSGSKLWDAGEGFTPIVAFAGSLDERNHSIDNLYMNRPTERDTAIFGSTVNHTSTTTVIRDLTIKDPELYGDWYHAALVAEVGNYNRFENVHVIGGYLSSDISGGLFGAFSGNSFIEVDGCSNSAIIFGVFKAAGIVGEIWNTEDSSITDCYNFGFISGANYAAGIAASAVGAKRFRISRSANFGTVTVDDFAAGIIDRLRNGTDLVLDQVANYGAIIGNDYIAGIAGEDGPSFTISNSFNMGPITGLENASAGILSARWETDLVVTPRIQNVFNSGTIENTQGEIGGIGGFWDGFEDIIVKNVFSSGSLFTLDGYIGALIGHLYTNTACDVDNAHWIANPSMYASAIRYADWNVIPCTGVQTLAATANAFHSETHAAYQSWDFDNIWQERSGQLPTLRNLNPPIAATSCFQDGVGSTMDPYIINSCECLQQIEFNPLRIEDFKTKSFALGGHLECAGSENWHYGLGFIPIHGFTGTFNGHGFEIRDLTVNNYFNTGIFANLVSRETQTVVVQDLKLKNINIYGTDAFIYVGGLAGLVGSNVTIERVAVLSGDVTAGIRSQAGGIVGAVLGENVLIKDSYSLATVTSGNLGCASGIVGKIYGTVTLHNVYNAGIVGPEGCGGLTDSDGEVTLINVFSAAQAAEVRTGIGGTLNPTTCASSEVYWQSNVSVTNHDITLGACAAGIVSEIAAGSTNYFYDADNLPLLNWDFVNVWEEVGGDFPRLR